MTSNTSAKIGFWSVVSIVLSSQIGSGIFMLPSSLAFYGSIGLASWLISGTGAILLALVFADLCRIFPKTGGPHVFVQPVFKHKWGFLTAWSYWIISWASSSLVVVAAVGYLGAAFGGFSQTFSLILEVMLVLMLMGLNLRGVRSSTQAEFIFTVLKIVPLIVLPLACLPHFQMQNLKPFNLSDLPTHQALAATVLLTFWGFIGIECATTPAGSVESPQKTIPRALVFGTIAVALIYLINCVCVMGVMAPQHLQLSQAPYADVARIVFGGQWHVAIALMAFVVCMGTLNAWILTSGQIALGAAQDQLFPKIFSKVNRQQAPTWAVIISSLSMIPLLFLTMEDTLVAQLTKIIDASVTAFLFIYTLCILSYVVLCFQQKFKLYKKIVGLLALLFCGWTIYASHIQMIIWAVVMFASGIPVYHLLFRQKPSKVLKNCI